MTIISSLNELYLTEQARVHRDMVRSYQMSAVNLGITNKQNKIWKQSKQD